MPFHLDLSISESGVNVANNTSIVTIGVTCVADNGYSSAYSGYATSVYVSCDTQGEYFTVPSYNIGLGGKQYLGSKSFTVTHNADGSKWVSASATFYANNDHVGTPSASTSLTLTTIPRKSSFTVSGNTIGSAITVSISRASSSFTHKVIYQFGNIRREYTNVGTSQGFTPPLSDCAQIPNSQSGQGTITVETYSGSTNVGSNSQAITLYVPTSVVPTVGALNVARDDNGVPSSWNLWVQNKSKAKISITGYGGSQGSTIKSISIKCDKYSSTGASLNTGVITGSGDVTISATVTDSRGRSDTRVTKITVYANNPPSLTLTAVRCNKDMVATNEGKYLKVVATYSCASINGKNSISSKTFAISGTSYKDTTSASGSSFILGNDDIAISRSYEVTGVVTDALGQSCATVRTNVGSSSVPVNTRDDKTGIAFGKYSEKQNAIDSAWPVYVKDKKLLDETDTASNSRKLDTGSYPSNIERGLFYVQSSNDTSHMPDSNWWHLLRLQHPNYANGYWVDLALPFFGDSIKFRRNNNGGFTDWKSLTIDSNCPLIGTGNGWTYYKFPSGLLIQTMLYNASIVYNSNLAGGFAYAYIPAVADFPITFYAQPATNAEARMNTYEDVNVSYIVNPLKNTFSKPSANGYIGYILSSSQGLKGQTRTFTFFLTAIGRWK